MTDHLQTAASEQEAITLARESFIGELKSLNRKYPDTGFGISLKTRSGDLYLLANAKMPLPQNKSDGFPTGHRVACLENGDRFSSIEVLADSNSYESIEPNAEAAILGNAIDLISRIDALSDVPVEELAGASQEQIVATGTGG